MIRERTVCFQPGPYIFHVIVSPLDFGAAPSSVKTQLWIIHYFYQFISKYFNKFRLVLQKNLCSILVLLHWKVLQVHLGPGNRFDLYLHLSLQLVCIFVPRRIVLLMFLLTRTNDVSVWNCSWRTKDVRRIICHIHK